MKFGLTVTPYDFPTRTDNHFRLLIDGGSFYPAMLQAIAQARRYIALEMYLFESGVVATRFIEALAAAVQRGVSVYLLLDHYGATGLRKRDRMRMANAGIQLIFYNPLRYDFHIRHLRHYLFRNHRKLLVVDGVIAYTGGVGITDEFDPPHYPQRAWRDTMVEIQGPVLQDWVTLFSHSWQRCRGKALDLPPAAGPGPAGTQVGRVAVSLGPTRMEIKRALLNRIQDAKHRLWVATAYFVPTHKLLRALRKAAQRGIDVRLLLPGPHSDHPAIRHAGRRYYYGLLRHGVRIFEYQPRFMHSKVLLSDHWVSIGSSNIDRWNFYWNLEANQEIEDPDFAEAVHLMLLDDFAQSHEYRLEEWRVRPWYRRWIERFWGWVDIALMRLTKQRPEKKQK